MAANELEESLTEIFAEGKNIQKEYLGFEAEDYNQCDEFGDVKLTIDLLNVVFKELFPFSVPTHKCDSKGRILVFLEVKKMN